MIRPEITALIFTVMLVMASPQVGGSSQSFGPEVKQAQAHKHTNVPAIYAFAQSSYSSMQLSAVGKDIT